MTDEEWRAVAIRGGKRKQAQARERAALRDSGRNRHHVPGPTLARAIEEIDRLLVATVEPGSSEPDYLSRAWGLLALATLFRIRLEQRAEILELLTRVRPKVAADPQSERLLDLKRARDELLRAYEVGAIDAADLPPELLELVGGQNRTGARGVTS
jgi:hypothetical protein